MMESSIQVDRSEARASSASSSRVAAGRPPAIPALRVTLGALEKISPEVAGRLSYTLFHHVTRRRPNRDEAAFLARAQRSTLEVGVAKVPVYRWGDERAEAILLVHGWEGYAGQFTDIAKALLAAGFRVVAFDAPGHGAATGRSTSTQEMARIIERLLVQQGFFRAIVAHSFGAMVASAVVKQHPDQFTRAVLISGVFGSDTLLEGFQAITGASDRVVKSLTRWVERLHGHSFWAWSGENLIPDHAIPTTLIHDEDDRDVPCREAHRYADAWPATDLHLTRGLGHRRILRDPAVVERVVAAIRA